MRTYKKIKEDPSQLEKPVHCTVCGRKFQDDDLVCEIRGSYQHVACCSDFAKLQVCGTCGQELEPEEICSHLPDVFLLVWNCRPALARTRYFKDRNPETEVLPLTLPKTWVDWVLETCSGSLNVEGVYRLPGMLWEWAMATLREDMAMAKSTEEKIDHYLADRSKG